MPREVIMPALGMAQDTGLIVAWHKSAGDAVKSDDVLFEVETDKATMEVPAGADGFVTQIKHHAGDEVPVGDVIAVIGERTEAVHTNESPADAAEASADVPTIDGNEVIMPALGMAQDTGLIVAWHKAPGDKVTASDVLFEVETDKATMEVEAGHDGFVAALFAEAGEEAPVGDVIAVISADKPEKPVQSSLAARAAPVGPEAARVTPENQAPEAPQETPATAKPMNKSKAAPLALEGPILASPKAKRLALEQGLDLAKLATAGIPMPYHVADLDTLKSLPDSAAETRESVALNVTARIERKAFTDFIEWLGNRATREIVWASFAAASMRAATDASALVIRVDQPLLGRSSSFADPDRTPLSMVASAEPDTKEPPNLIVRDLTGSVVTGGVLGTAAVPALTVTDKGADYVLKLDFNPGHFNAEIAIALVDGFAGRLQQPIRHLL